MSVSKGAVRIRRQGTWLSWGGGCGKKEKKVKREEYMVEVAAELKFEE